MANQNLQFLDPGRVTERSAWRMGAVPEYPGRFLLFPGRSVPLPSCSEPDSIIVAMTLRPREWPAWKLLSAPPWLYESVSAPCPLADLPLESKIISTFSGLELSEF